MYLNIVRENLIKRFLCKKGSCPAYSISGLNFSSSPNVDKYIGAFSAKIGTPLLEDVCWYDDSLDCPENSCAVDLRRLPVRNNTGIGVWCVTNGYNNGCPTNFTAASTQFAAYRDQMDFISGALAQSIGCKFDFIFIYIFWV